MGCGTAIVVMVMMSLLLLLLLQPKLSWRRHTRGTGGVNASPPWWRIPELSRNSGGAPGRLLRPGSASCSVLMEIVHLAEVQMKFDVMGRCFMGFHRYDRHVF